MDNVHQQVGMQWFQQAGAFNNPDLLFIGASYPDRDGGGMNQSQYRVEFFLYAILGAPLILSCDLEAVRNDSFTRDIVLNPEILGINQDKDCVQGTSIGSFPTGAPFTVASERWAADTWIKPLSDGSFAVVLVNKDPHNAHVLDIRLQQDASTHDTREDFYPAGPFKARIRDVANRTDVGIFSHLFQVSVPPQDAKIYRVYPQDQ